jgi:hypothetical protein
MKRMTLGLAAAGILSTKGPAASNCRRLMAGIATALYNGRRFPVLIK